MKAKVTKTLYWISYEWRKEPQFALSEAGMEKSDPRWVVIREVNLEFDVPDDFDPVPSQIASLKRKKKEIQAETNVKVNNIEEQIQALLAIEHKPEPA